MINVLQRLAALDEKNPRVEKPMVSEIPVLGEGIKQLDISMPEPDTSDLRKLSGLNESKIQECGIPGMGAPMPSTPASLSMTAASGAEIVTMMRGLADIASGNTGMPAMGAEMPGAGGHKEPMFAEPEHGAIGGAGEEPMGGVDAGEVPVSGPTFGDDGGEEGSDELADMMKKLKTGQPVKISTNMPVKVKTSNPVSGGEEGGEEGEDEGMEESMRQWDSSPNEQTREYNPNDFARIFNKVKELDVTKAPRLGDNPLKAESVEKEVDPFQQEVDKLFAEYRNFVNEGKKAKKDYDGDGNVESGKDEYMGSRDKAIKKAIAKKK